MTPSTTLPRPADKKRTADREERRLAERRRRYTGRSAIQAVADARYAGRWEECAWRSVASCGRALVAGSNGLVAIKRSVLDDGARAGVSGVQHCGAVSLCEVCSARIRGHRAIEVGVVAAAHRAAGGDVAMLTLTVSHHREDPLSAVCDTVKNAWRKLQRRKAWCRAREQMAGTVVATEVTLGANGWHVHLHVLVLWLVGARDGGAEAALIGWGPSAWAHQVHAEGGMASLERGWHWGDVTSDQGARYVAKIAGETARSDYKSRDALRVISGLVAAGEAYGIRLWDEWVGAMAGKRIIRFSPGLRELYLPDEPELTDEEIVEQELGGDVVGYMPKELYLGLLRRGPGQSVPAIVPVLERIEVVGSHPLVRPIEAALDGGGDELRSVLPPEPAEPWVHADRVQVWTADDLVRAAQRSRPHPIVLDGVMRYCDRETGELFLDVDRTPVPMAVYLQERLFLDR